MRIILVLIVVFMLSSCYNVERNCNNFRIGTFEFTTMVGAELLTSTFVRNDSIEIDYFRGKTDTSSIRWINDCEYIVKKIHPKNRSEQKAIHMKILTTSKSEYKFEYSVVGDKTKRKGIVKKIKDTRN